MTEDAKARVERSPEEKAMIASVARAIWRTEIAGAEDRAEKVASWSTDRREFLLRANKLLNALAKEKLHIVKAEE